MHRSDLPARHATAHPVPDAHGLNLYHADPVLARLLPLYLPADLLAVIADSAADAHGVATVAARQRQIAGNGLDVEDVRAAAAVDGGDRTVTVRAFHGKYVAVRRVAHLDLAY